jgi:hypothetical protein
MFELGVWFYISAFALSEMLELSTATGNRMVRLRTFVFDQARLATASTVSDINGLHFRYVHR